MKIWMNTYASEETKHIVSQIVVLEVALSSENNQNVFNLESFQDKVQSGALNRTRIARDAYSEGIEGSGESVYTSGTNSMHPMFFPFFRQLDKLGNDSQKLYLVRESKTCKALYRVVGAR